MQKSTQNQVQGNQYPHLDFKQVKQDFSLSRVASAAGINVKRVGHNKYVMNCPFHVEDTASCHIFDDRRYTCFGCGAKGTVIDFVLNENPALENSPAKAAKYLIETHGTGWVKDYRLNRINSSTPTEKPKFVKDHSASLPAVKRINHSRSLISNQAEALATLRRQFFDPEFDKARTEAVRRGWWNEESNANYQMIGAKMASEGKSFLALEPAIAIPKCIRTKRTAELFRLEEEFEQNDRLLCVGVKKRLLPETIARWEDNQKRRNEDKIKAPRWLCDTGFVTEIPWEFDANEDAEILVITEGPGDGLRLYNEANFTSLNRAKWGERWHITAADSCHIWDEHSMPRRPMEIGSDKFSVGFFDGFSHIVILLDGDEPGRKGAENIVRLAMRQKSEQATVRNVVLPENMDVCDFFDSGREMDDLTELFRLTPAIR